MTNRNKIIDEVLQTIASVNDHLEPMPEHLKDTLADALEEHGTESLMRMSAEVIKETIITKVKWLKK
jgi:hypothetical protein